MRSLSVVSWRHLARRKGRAALTAIGTALGVAVLFGVLVQGQATSRALDGAIRAGAGESDVLVSPAGAFDATLPADLPAALAARPGVERAIGSLLLRTSLRALAPGADGVIASETVNVRADDPATATPADIPALSEGRLPAPGADEIAVEPRTARRLGLSLGDPVAVGTTVGDRPAVLVGVLADAGGGFSEGGAALTSLEAARRLDGRGPVFTRVAVVLQDGVDPARWIADARAEVPGVSIEDVDGLAAGFRAFIAGVNSALTLTSAIALFVGAFLIFLTFSLAVAERTRVYGTLRALGAVPRQVRRVVVTEAALLGLGASVVGLVLGLGIAAASAGLVESLLGLDVPGVGFPLVTALFSVAVGVGVSVAAAWVPGRRAAALGPVAAMRGGAAAVERPVRWWPAVALMLGATVLVVAVRPSSIALSGLATLSFLLGAVLAVPAVLSPLARVLGRLTARLAPGVGPVAVLHLVKERSRSAYTLGLVMVVLALLLAVGASNLAMARTLDDVVERQAGGNVQVYATNVFDPAVRDELAGLDGVELVSPLRFGSTDVSQEGGGQRTRSFLAVIEPETYFDVAGFAWVDGSDAEARAALAAGGAILLPSGVAGALGVERGGTVDVDGTGGVVPMTLAGTYAVLGGGFGAVVGTADGARFGVGRPNGFLLDVGGGQDAEAVAAAAAQRLADRYVVTVETPEQVRDRARAQLQGFFAMGYAILGVAAVIGLLGLANTLVVSVLTRTRELGVLRSVGALRRQVRRMVLVEAGTLVLVALVLALPLGAVMAAALIAGQRASLGFTISYEYPWALVLPLSLAALVVTAVASLLPSRRAGRLDIVDALRFD